MKKRVISAIIALIVAIPLIYIGGIPFYIFALVLALLGFTEILNLIVKDDYIIRLISYVLFLFLCGNSIINSDFNNLLEPKILGVIFLVFFMLALINHKNEKFDVAKCFYLLGVTLFLGVAFSTIIITRNMSIYYFIYLFLITIMTDTFAHLVGSLIGKHKINEISPNKSYEGAIAGSVFGTIISVLFYMFFINKSVNLLLIIFITLLLSIIGQFGDLFFSLVKRHYKIKDFSNIMPGHGGILDRLDSIIFVMLAFTYFVTFI